MQTTVNIRAIKVSDTVAFQILRGKLDRESKFMLLEPDERKNSIEKNKREIEFYRRNGHGTILVAEVNQKMAGYLSLERGGYRRIQHTAYLVIGILKEFGGQGIGSSLIEQAIDWCRMEKVQRIELTVLTHNSKAIALYEKFGFEKEGIRKNAMRIDGEFADEYYMAKLL